MDPRSHTFWDEELVTMFNELSPVVQEAYLAGAATGLEVLPPSLSVLANFDAFNTAALEFLNEYSDEVFSGINETTRRAVVQEIEQFVTSGENLQNFIPRFTQAMEGVTYSDARIKSIAVTEVTRIFAEGNLASWQSIGFISGKRWMTVHDERVCQICGPLHMQVVDIEGSFSIPEDQLTPELQRLILQRGDELFYKAPPAHVNCRCWLQPFVTDVGLEEEIQALIEGFV